MADMDFAVWNAHPTETDTKVMPVVGGYVVKVTDALTNVALMFLPDAKHQTWATKAFSAAIPRY